MAYVRLTETLITDVRTKIESMKNKALDPYRDTAIGTEHPMHERFTTVVETHLWRDAPELRGVMPEGYLHKFDNDITYMQLSLRNSTASEYDETVTKQWVPPTGFKAPLQTPALHRYSARADIPRETWEGEIGEWYATEVERAKEHSRLSNQYNETMKTVRQFLESQKSLNAALKELPELEMYVPGHYLDRVKEKVVRANTSSVPDAPKVEVDRDQLASLAIAHRMATARD